jgi:hypothetical protein
VHIGILTPIIIYIHAIKIHTNVNTIVPSSDSHRLKNMILHPLSHLKSDIPMIFFSKRKNFPLVQSRTVNGYDRVLMEIFSYSYPLIFFYPYFIHTQ